MRFYLFMGMMTGISFISASQADDRPAASAAARKADKKSPAGAAAPAKIDDALRSYPSLPGAVCAIPERLMKNAPFDVARIYAPVPHGENAAPLYLDALYEFVPNEMESCISPEESAIRGPAARERVERTSKVQFAATPEASPDERAAIVAEYEMAFEKLASAQHRKRCVFETGIGIDARLPHALAARQVVRLLDLRVDAHVREGAIAAALDDVDMALRLSRDLRPRGSLIPQLISVALDSTILTSLVPTILGAPRLEVAQCDRLLDMISRHEREGGDVLVEGFRMEYLLLREMLYRIENEEDDMPDFPDTTEVADEELADLTPQDFADELDALNRFFRPLVNPDKRTIREWDELLSEQQPLAESMKLLGKLLPTVSQFIEAACRDRTRLGATRCLVALRRWQCQRGTELPQDLLTVCKAAGMKSVPIDEYSESGEPLRSTMIDGEFVIYSVARDKNDDQAQFDWDFGKYNGDWIFRLPAAPKP